MRDRVKGHGIRKVWITTNGGRGCPGGGFFLMMFLLLARGTHREVLFPWK